MPGRDIDYRIARKEEIDSARVSSPEFFVFAPALSPLTLCVFRVWVQPFLGLALFWAAASFAGGFPRSLAIPSDSLHRRRLDGCMLGVFPWLAHIAAAMAQCAACASLSCSIPLSPDWAPTQTSPQHTLLAGKFGLLWANAHTHIVTHEILLCKRLGMPLLFLLRLAIALCVCVCVFWTVSACCCCCCWPTLSIVGELFLRVI